MNKKYNLNSVKEIINKLGYTLISDKYEKVIQKIIISDINGYVYTTNLHNLLNGETPRKFHISNPYTIQNIKLFLIKNHLPYTLISNSYTSMEEKIILKDFEGYIYQCNLNNLYNNMIPEKFHKSNPYTIQNIKLWCKLNNKPFELISDVYLRAISKLKWKCLKDNCGGIFEASWDCILQGVNCGVCNGRQVYLSNSLATKNPELAKQWHPTKNEKLTPYDVTCGSNKKVWWVCEKGHEWNNSIYSQTLAKDCPYCSKIYASTEYNLLVINPELCEEWNYDKNKKSPKNYCPNSGMKVWWKCNECGYEWSSIIANRNKGIGCPQCNISKGEKEIKRILDLNGICYISQKEFDGLVGIGGGNLSYDFYLPNYNVLIEYQGEFHDGNGKIGNYYVKQNLKYQQEHDNRKKQFAIDNNITFLEIWYYDFAKIEETLNKELNL